MAKSKRQRIKHTKQPRRKKSEKETDISELQASLDVLGLKIIHVTADGNCFFRALADQLEGNEDEHEKYRNMVVQYIKNNREMFEPFVEDEVPFDEYCLSMGQEGNWAGHMELQAASLVTNSNICIHRHMSPRWYTQNFDMHEARMIHLSYHDGEHYNSVRSKDDTCSGPARPIVIKEKEKIFLEESIEFEDSEKIEQTLNVVDDVGAEMLTAEQGSGDHNVAVDKVHDLVVNSSCDEHQDMNCEHHKLTPEDKRLGDLSNQDVEGGHSKNAPYADEKKTFKSKACPCGSEKKYKSCCGSGSGKSTAKISVDHAVDYMKDRKGRKQARRGSSIVVNSVQSNGRTPDMGALCI